MKKVEKEKLVGEAAFESEGVQSLFAAHDEALEALAHLLAAFVGEPPPQQAATGEDDLPEIVERHFVEQEFAFTHHFLE